MSLSSLGGEASENLILTFTVSATDNKPRTSSDNDVVVIDTDNKS